MVHINRKMIPHFIPVQNLLHLRWQWSVSVVASLHSHTLVTPADWSMYVLLGGCQVYWWPLLFWTSSLPCHLLARDHFQLQTAETSFSAHLRVNAALPRSLCMDEQPILNYISFTFSVEYSPFGKASSHSTGR